ncbi:MAG TPA: carboxypeptidase-like regulatory domain-containing protein [Bryobacteraceae bacterium]|nr:carboxypeptidase-like regulatory domain-containing protein [Bryobacteraceae bacterium]
MSTAFAQFETSSALGSLLDPNGAATGNARVTITNFETGVEQKAVSDNSGACQFLEVRLGRYRLAAEAAGLKRAESAEFRVDAGARQRVDMRLEIGAVSQKSA